MSTKLKVFSVKDSKANAHITPFFLPTTEMAIRVFSDCAKDTSHDFGKHPEDYTLFEQGSFDVMSGTFQLLDTANPIGKAVDFIIKE